MDSSERLLPVSRRARTALGVVAAFFVLLLVGPRVVFVYTDWLWFSEVGYQGVWAKVLMTRLFLFVAVTVVIGIVIFLALLSAYRSRPLFVDAAEGKDPVEPYRTMVMGKLRVFGVGIPLLIAIPFGLHAQANWATVQLFLHGATFDITDVEFGHDIGFYVFDLPFYRMVLNWLFVAVVLASLVNLCAHCLFGGVKVPKKANLPSVTRPARIQLAVSLGIFVLLKAVAYWFDRYSLLWSARKEPTFTGAGFTDINAVLPAKLILLSIAVVCAATFFAVVVVHDLRIPAMAAALLILSSILVGGVWPALVEQFSVRPNAADRERSYIERNIDATRQAYGLSDDRIEYVDYPGVGTRPPRDVPADVITTANARLLDPNILSRTFTQQQQLKNFYGFTPTLDIDRYALDGKLADYIVAVRELSPNSLSGNQTQWINRHTVYTHGNGFVAAPANRVNAAVRDAAGQTSTSDSGYPIYTVSDIASQSAGRQLIPVQQPRIYYGEVIAGAEPDYAVVGSHEGSAAREYDTDTSQYTYTGRGGVPIGSWINRVAFALRYTERNILFSSAIGPESKILYHRDPAARIKAVAPWLTTDSNPYPAVVDGRIIWIVDGYTTVAHYPYSQPGVLTETEDPTVRARSSRNEISYARNSVKATVDAYDGTVTLYQVDEDDPILDAWTRVFPGAVKPGSEISDDLRAHFRYPEDLFRIQRERLAKYHVNDPREFFTNNAFWSVPSDPTSESIDSQLPYYILVGDQDTAAPSFRLASAMVGFNREFLSAYISVHSDPDRFGTFEILKLPTDTQTQGPQQTQNSMISDTRVASERTLLERSNRIHYGNLLTLPIADGGFLYVEPLFTERLTTQVDGSTFPQLSRVLVSYREPGTGGVRVGYAPTLAEALDQVFGSGTGTIATPPGGDARTAPSSPPTAGETPSPDGGQPPPPDQNALTDAVLELNRALDEVRQAQQQGFAAYGAALERLQSAIDVYLANGGGQ